MENLLCKVDSLFSQVNFFPPNFFPPNFPFPKYKRKIWREKIYLAKERVPVLIRVARCPPILFSFCPPFLIHRSGNPSVNVKFPGTTSGSFEIFKNLFEWIFWRNLLNSLKTPKRFTTYDRILFVNLWYFWEMKILRSTSLKRDLFLQIFITFSTIFFFFEDI